MPAGMMKSDAARAAHEEAREANRKAEQARIDAVYRRTKKTQTFQRPVTRDKAVDQKVIAHHEAGKFRPEAKPRRAQRRAA